MIIDLENPNLEELIVELKRIGTLEDRMERSKEVEAIKSSFYRQLGKLKAEAEAAGQNVAETFAGVEENFKNVYSDYKRERAEYNRAQDALRQDNYEKKSALIAELKDLVDNINDVQATFPALREIQAKWKEIGPVPETVFNEVNKSYQRQMERFYDMVQINHELRDLDFKKNLEAKEELCAQAEELAKSDNVIDAFNSLQLLHEQWKEIGPVARKQSDAVWKRFRAACDTFFNNKAKHFSSDEEEYAKNLAEKRAVIEEIRAYAITGDKEADVAAMRGFIDKFNEIGFVPFKEKAAVQQAFNAVMDEKFGQIRNIANEKELSKFKKRVADIKSNAKGGERSLKFERDKLLQRFRKMEQDIAVLENNMGFFAKSKNAEIFKADIQKKIADAREEMARLEEKIRMIDKEF